MADTRITGLPEMTDPQDDDVIAVEDISTGLTSKLTLNNLTHAALHHFVDLDDVPDAYTGNAGKVVTVKAAEDGLEFTAADDVDVDDFTDMTDTPDSYVGDGGKLLAVTATEDGVEFISPLDTLLELTDTPAAYTGKAGYKITVNATEDGVEFTNGDAYGYMYVQNNTTPQAVTTAWLPLIPAGSASGLYENVVLNPVTGVMTVNITGTYQMFLGLSFSGGNSQQFDFALFKNGVLAPGAIFTRKMGVGGDIGSGSFQTVCSITAGDEVAIYVKAGATTSLTVKHGQFNVHKIDR